MRESVRFQSVADIEGPWVEPNFDSGLVERLRRNWTVPIRSLTNEALATFIRQRLGLPLVVSEASNRVKAGFNDDSELYEGELAKALNDLGGAV